MPDVVLRIIEPQILQILRLLGGVLKPAVENNIVLSPFSKARLHWLSPNCAIHLEVGHPVSASCRRAFLALDACPFARAGFKTPEIVIMVEGPLARARELAPK
jgi:hypothetical protein